jgi:proteasome accessory factor C
MPPVPAGRKFEVVTQALALAEERGYIALTDAAAEIGVTVDQLRELLEPVLYLEFPDAQGEIIGHTHEFALDEDDVLQLEPGHTNWLRDLVAAAPSNEGLLRLYVAATVFQATSPRESADLDRALAKLRQAIAMEMVIPVDRPRATKVADDARTAHRSLRFRYVKWKSSVAEDREILPYDVYSDWGHWYVWGPKVDDPDGIVRTWRLDRMHDPVVGDRTFDPPLDLPPHGWFDLSEHTRTVTVVVPETRLPALPRPHTVESRELLPDGRVRAVIEVAGDRQLDHLLVSLGPDGEVLDPPEYAKRRRDEARRLLAHVEGA